MRLRDTRSRLLLIRRLPMPHGQLAIALERQGRVDDAEAERAKAKQLGKNRERE